MAPRKTVTRSGVKAVASSGIDIHQDHQRSYIKNNNDPDPGRISFLDLPPEIRNMIYTLAAQPINCVAVVRGGKRNRVPALLLASQQIRTELLTLMLHTTPLKSQIFNFNFNNFASFLRSLPAPELAAIKTNPFFEIQLHTTVAEPYKRMEMDSLFRWLQLATTKLRGHRFRYKRVDKEGRAWFGKGAEWAGSPARLAGEVEMRRLHGLMVNRFMRAELGRVIEAYTDGAVPPE